MLAPDGKMQDANRAFRKLAGYDEKDLTSLEYAELFEDGDRADVSEEVRQLSEGASAIRKEGRTLRSNGGPPHTVKTLSVLIRDWEGEPDHIFVVLEATPEG